MHSNGKSRCELCVEKEWKYRCPKCEIKTCSLECSKKHKEDLACDGIKSHIAQKRVKMDDFDLGLLKKDMQFLE